MNRMSKTNRTSDREPQTGSESKPDTQVKSIQAPQISLPKGGKSIITTKKL